MIDYVRALNEAQYQAVSSEAGPLLVVAGAGSGKTRTIVYRLAWLVEQGVDPAAILLLTFTRKAAQEMLQRAGHLLDQGLAGVRGGTFHAFAFSALRRWKPDWLEGRSFTVMDAGDISAAIKYCREEHKLGKGDRSFPKTQTIVGLLSKARNKEQPLEEILQREAFHLLPHTEALLELDQAYTKYRHENALMDYDDLLFELENLLAHNSVAAACLRQRFLHILVDEYQDTNLVQARIVRLLADPEGEHPGSVMAVGDEAQSIYAFRGANVRNILDFPKLFPGARIIRLEENYRSTQPVLDVANSLLAHAAESFGKKLFTRKQGGEAVRLLTPLSDRSQANLVVRRIEDLLCHHLPHEIAVLFRAGFHSYALEIALNQAGIAFRKYGGLRYAEAAHVKDVIAYIRLILNPLDLQAFSRVASFYKGIGPKTVAKLHNALQSADAGIRQKVFARFPDLIEDMRLVQDLRLKALSPAEVLLALVDHYRPRFETLYPEDWPRRQQGLEEIVQIASSYNALDVFVADMALDAADREHQEEEENRVTLSTVHSAKGLEWDCVLLIDLVEERFPSRHALVRTEDFEEERRLMYVACTRARKILELYAPVSLYSRAECSSQPVQQSPFLREIAPGLVEIWREEFGGRLLRQQEYGHAAPVAHEQVRQGSSPASAAQLQPAEKAGTKDMAAAAVTVQANELCYCRHRIFGRGKIVRKLSEDKVQVNFPGFGLKVILSAYLQMEN
jgi:DNA helicase-2/ATP-dependent DNA helicase PcrA